MSQKSIASEMKTRKTAKYSVSDLPDEVLTTHIFSRLDVKSVGRCRCVSKPWISLLSTPEFTKPHLKFHADDPENLIEQCPQDLQISAFTGEGAISRKVNLPAFEALTDGVIPQIVGSGDGLILITTNEKRFGTILVNPVTLEYVNVSDDHLGESRSFGLGYDSSRDDYKIVKLTISREVYVERQVDVYSVKRKCWRRVGNTPYHNDAQNPGVFFNGCIHWMANEYFTFPFEQCPILFAFNLAREEFKKIPLPSGLVVNHYLDSLKVKMLKGRLTLVHKPFPRWGSFDVWVREEYGVQNSWTKLATINWPDPGVSYEVSCMLNGDEIIVERYDKQLLAYNWRSGVWRDVVVTGYKGTYGVSTIMTFRESIFPSNS